MDFFKSFQKKKKKKKKLRTKPFIKVLNLREFPKFTITNK